MLNNGIEAFYLYPMSSNPIAIAIHGGAGTIERSTMTPELQQQYETGLRNAVDAGYTVLEEGGSALDAVEAAVRALEDYPLFNAGRGAVFTADGTHEMDASVMNGKDRTTGAVAGVAGVRNPVTLARAVMEQSEHVLLAGQGAEKFAKSIGTPFEENQYFYTQERYDQLQDALKEGKAQLDHSTKKGPDEKKFGTVGAVALDSSGNLAAATSTGGMTAKKWGRVGDTPIAGAGIWADNSTCAISCTGHGEFFIRSVVAYDVHCLIDYKGMSLQEAAEEVVMNKLVKTEGEGGLVAVDAQGNIAMPFNSVGMYRACKSSSGREEVKIYKD